MKQEIYNKYKEEIIRIHFMLAGLDSNAIKYECRSKIDKAILNNLKQISVHAGEKRLGQLEYQEPSDMLALCQYEFMINASIVSTKNQILILWLEAISNGIRNLREKMKCPEFKSKDEVIIVEGVVGDKYKALTLEQFDKWQGEYNRLIPIAPEHLFLEVSKDLGGFMNYNGDERATVNFIMGD